MIVVRPPFQAFSRRNGLFWIAACCLIFCTSFDAARAADVVESPNLRVGIDGRFRPGHWTQVILENVTAGQVFDLQTLDGDAVRYSSSVEIPADWDSDQPFRAYVPTGPIGAPLELFNTNLPSEQEGRTVASPIFRQRLVNGAVAADRPWVVALGDDLGLANIGENEILNVAGSLDVSVVQQASELPEAWLGYDGVDYLVISGASLELLREMQPPQRDAMRKWLFCGGSLFLSLGERGADLLEAADWLADAIVNERPQGFVVADPAALEIFVSDSVPVEAFPVTRFEPRDGIVVLSGRSRDRQTIPLVTTHPIGLGKATVFAGGLDQPPIANWKKYEALLDRMLPDLLPERRKRRDGPMGPEVRYSELAGQVRLNLDQFEAQGKASFSVVAAMLLLVIAIIGPIDYLLINRFLGRPLLGWVSFPITIVAFSVGFVMWKQDGDIVKVRQISVIDIDPVSRTGRGFAWAQLFSNRANRLDLGFTLDGAIASESKPILTGTLGYPGRVFGGIEVAGEDVRLPPYKLASNFRVANNYSSSMLQIPIAPQSSRSLGTHWHFTATQEVSDNLQRRVGSDLLVGSFENPFDVDLLDGYLVYRNLIYLLPTRVPARGAVPSVDSLVSKNFRWRLNRRQTADDSSRSEPWNPSADNDLSRLMEIVLFYGAAGGAQYVGLENRELGPLDLSDLLAMDKAVLVGRISDPQAILTINGEAPAEDDIEHQTYVRIFMPVTGRSRQGRN